MSSSLNLGFVKERIPPSCHNLIDILVANELEAADRWLLEATSSGFGQITFVWGEFLTDLAHCYPLTEEERLTM